MFVDVNDEVELPNGRGLLCFRRVGGSLGGWLGLRVSGLMLLFVFDLKSYVYARLSRFELRIINLYDFIMEHMSIVYYNSEWNSCITL